MRGESAYLSVTAARSRNISVVAAMNKYGMIYYKIHERAVNGEDFKLFIKEINESCQRQGILTPIFVMDNARIHHYRGLNDDEEIASYRIKYLPPYSPFLNPIENVFSVWKNKVIRGGARTEPRLRILIYEKFNEITGEHCSSFYRKMLGYLQKAEVGQMILDLSFAINIPKSTLFDIFKISSTVKPTLTDKNKIDRLKFCLSKVNPANNEDLLFDNLYDYNRAKGTMITKNVESVTAKTIYVQQDNARPHLSDNDVDIVAFGSADNWNIKFKAQPANSPDLNVLDLGFFNSIQSLQHEASPHTIDELINCVQDAFYQLKANTLDNVFTTLEACMESIMLADGGNGYKILI
ncbi:DDE-like endonuclease [Hamiltosporidium tvaerminnensis]|uniref:DDE-like endonuclease n=1 Tax=Hamiltosporidium tvaerminnensis TaxID=1176355 RepID=A0A4Q9LV75_9MICR|nr:DDE-like endonuclease [Hamiltosporidium tvaerminnensis]